MKKLLTIILLLNCIVGFAFDTNGNFGIKQQGSLEAYQQYVGKTFFFFFFITTKKHGRKVDFLIMNHMQERFSLYLR